MSVCLEASSPLTDSTRKGFEILHQPPPPVYITKTPRPSPSIFTYCKRSNTGGGNGMGTRLWSFCCSRLGVCMRVSPWVFGCGYVCSNPLSSAQFIMTVGYSQLITHYIQHLDTKYFMLSSDNAGYGFLCNANNEGCGFLCNANNDGCGFLCNANIEGCGFLCGLNARELKHLL